jgi:two-component system, cell cycle sensor histidine kinase and response regulator CckA
MRDQIDGKEKHDHQGQSLQSIDEMKRIIAEQNDIIKGLEDSNETLRLVADKMHDIIRLVDKDGTIKYASPSHHNILGYESGVLLGKSLFDMIHPDEREKILFILAQGTDAVLREKAEYRLRHADGHYLWVKMTGNFIIDTVRGTAGQIITERDITERRQIDEALRYSENLYRAIFETTGAATLIIDEDGKVVLANQEAVNMTGYAKEELEGGNTWQSFIHPDDVARISEYNRKRKLNPDEAPRKYEFRMVDRHGGEKYILNTVALIPGTALMISSSMDITDLKKAEADLRDSEQKYRLLIEKANDAILIAQDGLIKFLNQKAMALMGYSSSDMTRVPFTEMIHPDDRQMVLKRHLKRMQGEAPPSLYTFRVITKWQDELLVEMNAIQIPWEGRPAILCFLRDITSDKKIEEQLIHVQKMEAIGTLAGGIAHDFNNLLMDIQGHASLMLLETGPSHPHRERLKSIEEQIRSGASLTRQLLSIASGGEYEVRPADLNAIIEKTLSMFARARKEVTIFKKFAPNLWMVEVDQGQIEQVLLNLFVNAWQAMPKEGELYLVTENMVLDDHFVIPYQLKSGRYVRVSVTDTGIGMDERTKARIFEPFFTTKEVGRGTGLGLASAYGIIKSHGGFIEVSSEKDQGTTFRIYLAASAKTAPKEDMQSVNLRKGKESVLIVDDEKMNIAVTTEMLEALGYKVISATSGQEAIYRYNEMKDEICLVILDMVMPGMGGGDTFDTLKEMNPDVKVILASGYSLDGQAKTIMSRGCRAFIQKPFSINGLSQKLRQVLDEN